MTKELDTPVTSWERGFARAVRPGTDAGSRELRRRARTLTGDPRHLPARCGDQYWSPPTLVRGRGVMAQATIGIRNIVALGYAEAVTRLERALQSIS